MLFMNPINLYYIINHKKAYSYPSIINILSLYFKAMMAKEQQEPIDSLAINSVEHSAVNLVSHVAQNDD